MEEKALGLRISKKAFLTSFFVLLALMVGAGVLTAVLPSGTYQRTGSGYDAQIVPGTYSVVAKASYPAWRWFTAPAEVLASSDGLQALVIIVFIMIVGGAFAILDAAKVLEEAVASIARKFASKKYLLLAIITLFFMGIGSLLGIFEETIPLVPVAIALSYSLGWDIYVGLGMSILATGFGFSAAISNPFSIGAAQRLSGVPLFSGAGFRVVVFLAVYALFFLWLSSRARRVEKKLASGVQAAEGGTARPRVVPGVDPRRGAVFFGASVLVLVLLILFISLTRTLAEYSMPIIALVFLAAGFGSGLSAGLKWGKCVSAFLSGVVGILPGVVLILMAMAVKHIIVSGGIIDTILYAATKLIGGSSGYGAASLIYIFVLIMNFFIGSATAKAFLLMPILAPLSDLAGISRQLAIQAFAFGDGFSNMIYPTNPVLLIALGVAGLSWPAWFKRTWALQAMTLALTMGLLMVAVAFKYS